MRSMQTLVWEAPCVMNVREQDVPKVEVTGFELEEELDLLIGH